MPMDARDCRLSKTIMHAMEINRSTLQTRIDAFLGSVLDVRNLPCSCCHLSAALPGSLMLSKSFLVPISGICPAYVCELRVLVSVLPVWVGVRERSANRMAWPFRNPNIPYGRAAKRSCGLASSSSRQLLSLRTSAGVVWSVPGTPCSRTS
jgi:hypothetical protein